MASRIALVTGGSRGIGAAICRALASEGYAVAVNFTQNQEKADEVVNGIKEKGGRAFAVKANVGDEADVVRMFETIDKELGAVTALVNNAGVIGPSARIEELTAEQITNVLATNVLGPMLCTREAIKRMSRKHGGDGGAIVNISSGSAYIGGAHSHVLYAVSKGGLNSFGIGASQELAEEGIRLNTVSPGITETDMVKGRVEKAAQSVPMKRAAQPEEIADVVVFALSDKASYMAGANIRVGGGRP